MLPTEILDSLERSGEPFLLTDLQGVIRYVSPGITIMTEYDPSELIGTNVRILKSNIHDTRLYDDMWETILSKQHWHGTLINRKKSGDLFTVRVSIRPVVDVAGTVTGFFSSMTPIEDLKDMTSSSEGTMNPQRIVEFMDQMSSEFRMALNSAYGFAEILREDLGERIDESQTEYLQIISSGLKRLMHTLGDARLIIQIDSGIIQPDRQEIAVAKEIKAILTDFAPMFDNGPVRLIKVIEDNGALISVDRQYFNVMIHNLLTNAYKFTEQGTVTVGLEIRDERAVVTVIDTGVGISEKFKENIFSPFKQEEIGYSSEFEGSGLGLALTKRLTELMGGEITFESVKHGGSTFIVKFPVVGWQSSLT